MSLLAVAKSNPALAVTRTHRRKMPSITVRNVILYLACSLYYFTISGAATDEIKKKKIFNLVEERRHHKEALGINFSN